MADTDLQTLRDQGWGPHKTLLGCLNHPDFPRVSLEQHIFSWVARTNVPHTFPDAVFRSSLPSKDPQVALQDLCRQLRHVWKHVILTGGITPHYAETMQILVPWVRDNPYSSGDRP